MVDVRKGLLGLLVAATATAGLAQPGGAQDSFSSVSVSSLNSCTT